MKQNRETTDRARAGDRLASSSATGPAAPAGKEMAMETCYGQHMSCDECTRIGRISSVPFRFRIPVGIDWMATQRAVDICLAAGARHRGSEQWETTLGSWLPLRDALRLAGFVPVIG